MRSCTLVVITGSNRSYPLPLSSPPSTSTLTVFDVDGLNALGLVGVNIAVSGCVPTVVSCLVMMKAKPLTTGTGASSAVFPSWNCMVPAAAPGATRASSSLGVPAGNGPAGNTRNVVLVSLTPVAFTTKVTGGDVDGKIPLLGVNTAVNWCDPTPNVDVVLDAVPVGGSGTLSVS